MSILRIMTQLNDKILVENIVKNWKFNTLN